MKNKPILSRIDYRLTSLRQLKKKALITYITAGDPSLELTEQLVMTMEDAGADIVELGIPYSDPLADGPVIQRATRRALESGTNLDSVFATVSRIRSKTQIPLAFLVYYNPILQYGIPRFLRKCYQSGVDGLIIPDLPLEERTELRNILAEMQLPISLIPLVAPTSSQRVQSIVADASGFIYCISSMGVTGQRDNFPPELGDFLKNVKSNTQIPTAIGFGISSPNAVSKLKAHADGVIVGSAIIKVMEDVLNAQGQQEINKEVHAFVKQLAQAL